MFVLLPALDSVFTVQTLDVRSLVGGSLTRLIERVTIKHLVPKKCFRIVPISLIRDTAFCSQSILIVRSVRTLILIPLYVNTFYEYSSFQKEKSVSTIPDVYSLTERSKWRRFRRGFGRTVLYDLKRRRVPEVTVVERGRGEGSLEESQVSSPTWGVIWRENDGGLDGFIK